MHNIYEYASWNLKNSILLQTISLQNLKHNLLSVSWSAWIPKYTWKYHNVKTNYFLELSQRKVAFNLHVYFGQMIARKAFRANSTIFDFYRSATSTILIYC